MGASPADTSALGFTGSARGAGATSTQDGTGAQAGSDAKGTSGAGGKP